MNTSAINTIHNFHQYDASLASGAQPTEEQLEWIRKEGYEAVVNISTPSARNALQEEARIVENMGMQYVHFPVDCTVLHPYQYLTFKGIMNGLKGKKLFVHCGGNIKSSNLLHMYNVLEKGENELQSFLTLQRIQTPEEKWLVYFKKMGMQGIFDNNN